MSEGECHRGGWAAGPAAGRGRGSSPSCGGGLGPRRGRDVRRREGAWNRSLVSPGNPSQQSALQITWHQFPVMWCSKPPKGTSEPKDAGPGADGGKRGGKRDDFAWWKRMQKGKVSGKTMIPQSGRAKVGCRCDFLFLISQILGRNTEKHFCAVLLSERRWIGWKGDKQFASMSLPLGAALRACAIALGSGSHFRPQPGDHPMELGIETPNQASGLHHQEQCTFFAAWCPPSPDWHLPLGAREGPWGHGGRRRGASSALVRQ